MNATTDFTPVCPGQDMDCAAETAILSYFMDSSKGGPNAKAVQTDGVKGSGALKYPLGLSAIRLMSYSTDLFTSPSARILGGGQFAMSFSNYPVQEGCSSVFPPPHTPPYQSVGDVPVTKIPVACLNPKDTNADLVKAGFTYFNQQTEAAYLMSPETAEFSALKWFFTDTAAGSVFFAIPDSLIPGNGNAPLNYLQIYGPDITYAEGSTADAVGVKDLLNVASEELAVIEE